MRITQHVTFCGINDREKPRFDNLYAIPTGMSYNSYVVTGDSAVALIDANDAAHAPEYIRRVEVITSGKDPDFLIVNHAEPDHTGAIPMLLLRYPKLKIVGNERTATMLRGFYGVPVERMTIVADGETLSLGDLTLKFIFTPMVHWPETMMTWLEEDKVMFTGDAFGCFGALSGAVIDDAMDDAERYFEEALRYYACIVAKYGTFVEKAITKVSPYPIEYLCTTHGPVWHSLRRQIGEKYLSWARWESLPGVTIVYGSMYGATAALAESLAAALAERGVRRLRVHDVTHSSEDVILADVMRLKGLVLAAPTYNAGIYPPMQTLAEALAERGVRSRLMAVMGSGSWAVQAARKLHSMLDSLPGNEMLPLTPELKQASVADMKAMLDKLADSIAAKILA